MFKATSNIMFVNKENVLCEKPLQQSVNATVITGILVKKKISLIFH